MMCNIFPIVAKMRDSQTPNVIISLFGMLAVAITFYVCLTLLIVNLYGQNINVNLFVHLENDNGPLSAAVKLVFLFILFFKIPYVFFSGKLSCFYIINELKRNDVDNNYSKEKSDPMTECDDKTYYCVCFAFLFGVVYGACTSSDLTFFIGILSAFYESAMSFIFPGMFYFCSMKNRTFLRALPPVAFIGFGVFLCVGSNYYNFMKVYGK